MVAGDIVVICIFATILIFIIISNYLKNRARNDNHKWVELGEPEIGTRKELLMLWQNRDKTVVK